MCDERTASKMSAYNTAKRNRLSPEHIVKLAQLHQHWTHGLEGPTYKHAASLNLPRANPSSAIHLPSPTLKDLLNPTTADEGLLFNHPDPYGAEFLNDGESDDDDPSVLSPITTRGQSVPRLEIDKLLDLTSEKLIARYSDGKGTGKTRARAVPEAVPVASPWVGEDWAKQDFDF